MLREGTLMRLPRQGGGWRVGALIGEGGQGAVFRLEPPDGRPDALAIKWYHDRTATRRQRDGIARLVSRGAPGPMFLWPESLVELDDVSGFGYVMPLRSDDHRPIGDLLLGRVDAPADLLLRLCIALADAFLRLHTEGLCYRDISFGNVFFDPRSGAPLICDNDNVGVDGDSFSAVLGTRKFMAPEVVRREALPSAQTDLHSLAVLLFYLLVRHHPLLGRREFVHRGREGEEVLLGREPLFIFDPDDEGNRPDEARQPAPIARWPRLPNAITTLFTQSFTTGLRDPLRRVRESVWRASLTRLLDGLHQCGWCGTANLTDTGAAERCTSCRRALDRPVRLRGERATVTLNVGTILTAHHLRHDYDFDTVVGRVVHDEARGLWGLQNASASPWRLERPGRGTVVVHPGQTAALLRGAVVVIGRTRFVLEAPGA